jgi:hypothetical protein
MTYYTPDYQIDDIVETENQACGTWEGPFEVVNIGTVNDFLAGGLVDVLYLVPTDQPKVTPPEEQDRPAHEAWKAAYNKPSNPAFYYPVAWSRKAHQ